MPNLVTQANFVWNPEKPSLNYFTDIPEYCRLKTPEQEFVNLCKINPSFAAVNLIGSGDFDLADFQCALLDMLWNVTFPLLIGSRGCGKSFILAVYCVLKALLDQNKNYGQKIIIVGSAFRQSKMIFDEILRIINMSPLILECDISWNKSTDRCEVKIGNSTIIALPMGTGDKIRGYRATVVIADEYAQIPEEIFQVVVRGFAAVSQNPVKRAKEIARMKKLLEQKIISENQFELDHKKNQIIIASSAYYEFNHLFKTYQQYLNIIHNKVSGNVKEYSGIVGVDSKEAKLNYKNFAVAKIPYTMLPEGFMDEDQITQAKLTMSDERFRMEFLAEFISDTKGFFKRSTIDTCTPTKFIVDTNGNRSINPDAFNAEIESDGHSTYVMGIDPARSKAGDNFAICVCKIENKKIKIVYVKTFKGESHIVIAKTIRQLILDFDIKAIGIDKGGGGQTLADILADEELSREIGFRVFDKGDERYQKITGRHIVELISYQGEWLKKANFDLQADFDNQRALFPFVNGEDKYIVEGQNYEGSKMEHINDAWENIEKSKDEICSIVAIPIGNSANLHFDLPDTNNNPFDTRRKDRYSAVLIATDQARKLIFNDGISENGQLITGPIDQFGWA